MKYPIVNYIVIRIILSIITLFIIILLNFTLLDYLEINPLKYQVSQYESAFFQYNTFINPSINNNFLTNLYDYYKINDTFFNRFMATLINYLSLNLGDSLYYQQPVSQLILQKINTTIKITLYSTLIIYLISFCLAYAINNLSKSFVNMILIILLVLYIIPSIIIAIFLSKYAFNSQIFAIICNSLGGLFFQTTLILKIIKFYKEQSHHIFLSFNNQKSKNLKNILYIVFADFPSIVLGLFFASSPFVEIIFNINGIGTLIYNSFIHKDYPLIMGIIFITSTIAIIFRLISDLVYNLIYKNIKITKIH
jgi:microcin C transport system permease protein